MNLVAYWLSNQDVSDTKLLLELVHNFELDIPEELIENPPQEVKDILRANTQEAVDRGAFGVPSFYLQDSHQ